MALDPIVAKMIASAYRQGHGNLHLQSLEQVRNHFQRFSKPSPYQAYVDHPLKEGVRMRFHQVNNSSKPVPLLFYLRASAFVTGDITDSDLMCYHLSKYLNCMVVAIEPRLSPEAKFPLPLEDCLDCIQYVMNNPQQLNINLNKTAIWGESSGGNLAAAICLYLKKNKNDLIKNQVLFYPMLDCSKQDYSSKLRYGKGFMLDNALSDWFLSQYVSSKEDFFDERVSPLLASNVEKLAPTLVIGAQYDPMRDEAACYVQKLIQAKVKVRSLFMPGLTHGFLWYTNRVEAARYSLYYAGDFLKEKWHSVNTMPFF